MIFRSHRRLLPTLALCIFALACCGNVFAATISYNGWYATQNPPPNVFTLTDWPNSVGSYASITLPQFNPALGTLTSVSITEFAEINSNYTVSNNSPGDITVGQYDVSIRVRIMNLGTTPVFTTLSGFMLEADPAVVSLTPQIMHVTDSISGSISASNDTKTLNISSGLSTYTGTGNLVFPLFTSTRLQTDLTGGNLTLSQTTEGRARITIQYTYDTGVPEPTTLVLFGSALVSIGVWGRKRFHKN